MNSLFEKIVEADCGIRPQALITPLQKSLAISNQLGCNVLLKLELMQPTGSFKVRGSANKLRVLDENARHRGVITSSTGNHGLGVARAGKLLGTPVTVYMGDTVPQAKIDSIRALGAEIVFTNSNSLASEIAARKIAAKEGKPYIPPYNDLDIVAGQGTIGLELARQAPDLDVVFICVGGGGLVSGVGTALKALLPKTRIIGVSPKASNCMAASLKAGRIIETPEHHTLSDGSSGGVEEGSVTFPICQTVIDEMLLVSETEIACAMRSIAQSDHFMVEGAAGVAMAGLSQVASRWRGKTAAVILCGRNVSLETYLAALDMAKAAKPDNA